MQTATTLLGFVANTNDEQAWWTPYDSALATQLPIEQGRTALFAWNEARSILGCVKEDDPSLLKSSRDSIDEGATFEHARCSLIKEETQERDVAIAKQRTKCHVQCQICKKKLVDQAGLRYTDVNHILARR